MPTTPEGITYPDSSGHTRTWEHWETMADDIDGLIAAIKASYEGDWDDYDPVWSSSGTQPAVGNGTLDGWYKRVGDIVHVRIVLVIGSTSTAGTGTYRISLPVAGKVSSLLLGVFKDASAGSARYSGSVEIIAATTGGDNMRINTTGGTTVWAATTPAAPATGDEMLISGTYEAA